MRKLRFLVPAATLLAILASSPAEAGWGHHHRHGGSYGSSGASYGGASYGGSSGYASYSGGSSGGSYGSSGGSYGSYGSGGSSGGPGLLARLHARIHSHIAAKRARHASHGSSGYSSYGSSGYSSYGSSGYTSYKSHGSSGYSSYGGSSGHAVHYSAPSASSGSTYSYAAPAVSYGVPQSYESAPQGYDSGVIMDQPYGEGRIIDGGSFPQSEGNAPPQAPQNEQGEAPAAEGEASQDAAPAEASIRADSALITLAVPASARVTVNGRPTTSEGPIRQFMSRGLKPGFSYSYLIEVEAMVDGRLTRDTKTLRVRAGDKERVVFDAPQATDVETALTVRVPADAKVILAGNLTSAEGETRVFRTQQLTRGQVWNDYEVVVTVVRDGRELTKKQVLQLVAGSERELAFSFDNEADAASLAAR